MANYDFIIVGAGIVGPALAKGLASHGRKVLLLERDLKEPDRIVGELLQPGGVENLKRLNMEAAVDGIDAAPIYGYQVIYNSDPLQLEYPAYSEDLDLASYEKVGHPATGRGFHHGRFVMRLRKIASEQDGVTLQQGTVTSIIEENGRVVGVKAILERGQPMVELRAKMVAICDGTSSKFRKDYSPIKPKVMGYFVGTILDDCPLIRPNYGHVILGSKHQPILVYQTSSREARILCDIPAPLPSAANLKKYVEEHCLPYLPPQMQPSFKKAIEAKQLRSMPNQYLPAAINKTPGLVMLGDAMNMRHPLTGGGMTVGLGDAYMLSELLGPKEVDLADDAQLARLLKHFYRDRKSRSSVVNVLSVALYSLFAAQSTSLGILLNGCFEYFKLGGDCVRGPTALLSGLLPQPGTLFSHFFAVAFYAIQLNFVEKGLVGFPLALIQAIMTLYTACVVFLPYLIKELL